MLGQRFAVAANQLGKSGATPFRELVDELRIRFPVGGDRYDALLAEVDAIGVSPHLRLPKPRDAHRTQDFGASLDEVRRGNAPGLRPVLLEWFWLRHPTWTVGYLERWNVEIPPDAPSRDLDTADLNGANGPEQFAASATTVATDGLANDYHTSTKAAEGARRGADDHDVCLVYAPADKLEIERIAELMERIGLYVIRLEFNRLNIEQSDRLLAEHAERSIQTVLYLSRHFFKTIWANASARSALIALDPMRIFSIIEATAHDIVALNAPQLLGMPTGYAQHGPEKLVENISRAVSRVRIGPTGLFTYQENFKKIESGRAFLEQEIQNSVERHKSGYGALLICDVDGMKNINARFGEEVGDLVLTALECMILDEFSSQDHSVGRCGDDTFYAAIYGGDRSAIALAEGMLERIRRRVWSELAPDLWVTCSIGAVSCRPGEPSVDTAIRASIGMIGARKRGGNGFLEGPLHLPHSGIARTTIRNYFS